MLLADVAATYTLYLILPRKKGPRERYQPLLESGDLEKIEILAWRGRFGLAKNTDIGIGVSFEN